MNELRGRRRLWDRADLDTSFPTWKKVHPKLKVRLESRFNLRSVLLDFRSFTEKTIRVCFCSPLIKCWFYHISLKTVWSLSLWSHDMQIGYEMTSNAHCANWFCPLNTRQVRLWDLALNSVFVSLVLSGQNQLLMAAFYQKSSFYVRLYFVAVIAPGLWDQRLLSFKRYQWKSMLNFPIRSYIPCNKLWRKKFSIWIKSNFFMKF